MMKKNIYPNISTNNMDCVPTCKLSELRYNNFIRNRAILEIYLISGVRAQELCNMKISHINLVKRHIVIPERNNHMRRTVVFSIICKELLSRYLSTRQDCSPYLFITRKGVPIRGSSISQILTEYCKRSSLQENFEPRAYRHTFATFMCRNSVHTPLYTNLYQ